MVARVTDSSSFTYNISQRTRLASKSLLPMECRYSMQRWGSLTLCNQHGCHHHTVDGRGWMQMASFYLGGSPWHMYWCGGDKQWDCCLLENGKSHATVSVFQGFQNVFHHLQCFFGVAYNYGQVFLESIS